MLKLLIVNHKKTTTSTLELFCTKLGYLVLPSVDNYKDAIHTIHEQQPDLLISDIKLNGNKTGLDIAQEAQKKYGIATLFLTEYYNKDILKQAKKIDFYGYIIMPYKENELEANIRLALYQVEKNRTIKKRYIDIYGYIFDIKNLKLYNHEAEIHLSDKSKKLLYYLSKQIGDVKSYEEIIDYVYDDNVSMDTLRHLVKRTKEIVGKNCIKSSRNIGYKLTVSF